MRKANSANETAKRMNRPTTGNALEQDEHERDAHRVERQGLPFGAGGYGHRLVQVGCASLTASEGRAGHQISTSTHIGAWSLVFSQPRGVRSTPAALSFFASGALSSAWSMRIPASRSNDCRQYGQKV